ncbi:MAG: hypothetical protein GX603_03045 [Chloroflexi bacterium]|nr:hypothetical protein [Chloroflexota bacterium]
MSDLKALRPADPRLAELLSDFPTRIHGTQKPVMNEEETARVLQLAEIAGIPVVVDGGWAVDALLGWQTREHADLDLAINQQYLPRLLNILRRLDYQYLPRADEWLHNFVLENGAGHQVDLHSFVRNSKGQIIGGVQYPGDSLTGQGRIAGMNVACIHPEWLVDFHLGYDFDHQDYMDVQYICNLFKINLPPEYQEYADRLYERGEPGRWKLPEKFTIRVPRSPAEYLSFTSILDKSKPDKLSSETQSAFLEMLEKCKSTPPISLQCLREASFRIGVLLLENGRGIGACELFPPITDAGAEQWVVRQVSLAKRSEYASLFLSLLNRAIEEARRAGATTLLALPLDDINQPREALLQRYDLGEIGFASFFARAGFKRLEPVPGSRWQWGS